MPFRQLATTNRGWRNLAQPGLLGAFTVSIIVHVMVYGTYKVGQKFGVWEKLSQARVGEVVDEMETDPFSPPTSEGEPPLLFVDVNPAAESTDAPENAKYYSDRSSKAANPLSENQAEVPLVDGSQTQMVRTEDVPVPVRVPLQPSAPPPTPEPPSEPIQTPTPPPSNPPKGDLLVAQAEETRKESEPKPKEPPPRPRTLKEAMARMPNRPDALAGRKMRQEGGVRRLATSSMLDVKASPFGEYDRAIIVAIQNRWFDLLDMRGFGHERSGKVVVQFRLHYDGRVSEMRVEENTVDEMLSLLCQKAVLDPAPYGRWPSDMRRMIGANHRDVRFTFYYN